MVVAFEGVTTFANAIAARATRMELRMSFAFCLVDHCEPPDTKLDRSAGMICVVDHPAMIDALSVEPSSNRRRGGRRPSRSIMIRLRPADGPPRLRDEDISRPISLHRR